MRPARTNTISAARPGFGHLADLTERLVLLVLLALVPFRAVANESATFEVPRMFRHLDAPAGALPATTFTILAILLGCAALLAFVRRRGPAPASPFRHRGRFGAGTGLEAGAAIIAAALIVSTIRAGQKHLALVGAAGALGFFVLFFALAHVLTTPWRVRLALVVVLATGAAVLGKCAYQKWFEIPETIRYYEAHKRELLAPADGGTSPTRDAGLLYDYEQRLRSGAVSGYFPHPNVLGSYLILVALAAAACAIDRVRHNTPIAALAAALIAAGAVVGIIATQSKGAAAALVVAVAVLGAAGVLRRRLSRCPRTTVIAGWLIAALAGAAVVTLLQRSPHALGRSMLFRSMYWQGAADMVRERGPWGVGSHNFDRFFTRYKPVECPEEVQDPHSWVMRALAEWGVLGLAGLLAALFGLSWRLASLIPASAVDPARAAADSRGGPEPPGSVVLWTAGPGTAFFAWWAALLSGADAPYVAITLFLPMLCWLVACTALGLTPSGQGRFDAAPLGGVILPIAAGLVGFLAHTAIDLAFFEPGPATTFFTLLAVLVAAARLQHPAPADQSTAPPRRGSATLVPWCGAVGGIAVLLTLAVPAAGLGRDLHRARTSPAPRQWDAFVVSPACQAYRRAAQACRFDGTALHELAEEMIRRVSGVEHVAEAMTVVDELRRRDPYNAVVWHHLTTLHYQRYALTRDAGTADARPPGVSELEKAVEAARRAVAAYPTSPVRRIVLAGLLEELAGATGSAHARREAATALQKALSLDEQRIYVSPLHRLSADERAALLRRIDSLQGK